MTPKKPLRYGVNTPPLHINIHFDSRPDGDWLQIWATPGPLAKPRVLITEGPLSDLFARLAGKASTYPARVTTTPELVLFLLGEAARLAQLADPASNRRAKALRTAADALRGVHPFTDEAGTGGIPP